MSDSPLRSPAFYAWTDPTSGVTSFVLKHVAGDLQRAWYFVTPSLGILWPFMVLHTHLPSRRYYSATVNLDPSNPEDHAHASHLGGLGKRQSHVGGRR